MNRPIQSKVGAFEAPEARKTHLNGIMNLINPKTGRTTKIENLTIAAIDAEVIVINLQLTKWG